MIKITRKLANQLSGIAGIGHFSEFGAVIGGDEFVLFYGEKDVFLSHITEYKEKGLLIRPKRKALKKQGITTF